MTNMWSFSYINEFKRMEENIKTIHRTRIYHSYVSLYCFEDFAVPIPKERSKKSDKESLTLGHFDPNNVRGQWRTSSDGVVKKYGRHGNYIKASPLASM